MVIEIRVIPKSSRNEVLLRNGTLTVAVTSAPEKGKANSAVLKVLGDFFGVGSSKLAVVAGETVRKKLISVPDEFDQVVLSRLEALGRTS